MKDIKSLYLSAKNTGRSNDIAAYTEAVQELLESNPHGYISNLEYIISSSIGLKTWDNFVEKYGLPIPCYEHVMTCLEKCINKCETRGEDASKYNKFKENMEAFRNEFHNCFSMCEYFADGINSDYVKKYYAFSENGKQGRRCINEMLKYGEAAVPDLIITAVSDGPSCLQETVKFLDDKRIIGIANANVYHQWLNECVEDLSEPVQLNTELTLESIVCNALERNQSLYRESVLSGNEAYIEYSEGEIEAIKDLIAIREHQMLEAVSEDELTNLQREVYSLYESLDGIIGEDGEISNDTLYEAANKEQKAALNEMRKNITDIAKELKRRVKSEVRSVVGKYNKDNDLSRFEGVLKPSVGVVIGTKRFNAHSIGSGKVKQHIESEISKDGKYFNDLIIYVLFTSSTATTGGYQLTDVQKKEAGTIYEKTLREIAKPMITAGKISLDKPSGVLKYDWVGDRWTYEYYKYTWSIPVFISKEYISKGISKALFEEYDIEGLLETALIEESTAYGEDTADSVIPMLPGNFNEDKWTGRPITDKTGGIPAFIDNNHDVRWGESDPPKKDDEDDDPSISDLKRPSADSSEDNSDVPDTELDNGEDGIKSPMGNQSNVTNYYYYTYQNSLNRNSHSFNKDNSSRDNHSKVDNSINYNHRDDHRKDDHSVTNNYNAAEDEDPEEKLEEAFEEFLNEYEYSGYMTESSKSSSIRDFKKRWHYDEARSTIKYEDKEYLINIDTDNPDVTLSRDILGKTISADIKKQFAFVHPNGKNGPTIIVNEDFWNCSKDMQDAVLLHEIGHVVCQMNKKPFPKSVKELIERIKKAIQRLVARIRMRKYRKGIHGNGVDEIEADLWAAKRVSPEVMKDMLSNIGKFQGPASINAEVENYIMSHPWVVEREYKNWLRLNLISGTDENRKKFMDEYKEDLKKRVALAYKNHAKSKDNVQRLKALSDEKLLNSKYFKNSTEFDDKFVYRVELESSDLALEMSDVINEGFNSTAKGSVIMVNGITENEYSFLSEYVLTEGVISVDRAKCESQQRAPWELDISGTPDLFNEFGFSNVYTKEEGEQTGAISITPERKTVPITEEEYQMINNRIQELVSNMKSVIDPITQQYPVFKLSTYVNEDDMNFFDKEMMNDGAEAGSKYALSIRNGKLDTSEIEIMVSGSDQYEFMNDMEKEHAEEVQQLASRYDINSRNDWAGIQWSEKICGYDKTLDEIVDEITGIVKTKFPMVIGFSFVGDNDSGPLLSGRISDKYIFDGIQSLGDIVITEAMDPDEKPKSDSPLRDIAMDVDRKYSETRQKVKSGVQKVQHVGRAVAKPVNKTKDWITRTISDWKDKDITKIEEDLCDPKTRNGLFAAIKQSIKIGSLAKAGLLLNPVIMFVSATRAIGKDKKKRRIRTDVTMKLKQEIEVCKEKIKDADGKDNAAKYKLMRIMNDLERKLLRVNGGPVGVFGQGGWDKVI